MGQREKFARFGGDLECGCGCGFQTGSAAAHGEPITGVESENERLGGGHEIGKINADARAGPEREDRGRVGNRNQV
jgi:hypothetical protein